MKLTAKHLRHIIREELAHTLCESSDEERYRIHLTDPPLPGHAGEPYTEEVTGEAELLEALGGVWVGFDNDGVPWELDQSDLIVVRVRDDQVVADIGDITWDAQGNATWVPRSTGYAASTDGRERKVLKMN